MPSPSSSPTPLPALFPLFPRFSPPHPELQNGGAGDGSREPRAGQVTRVAGGGAGRCSGPAHGHPRALRLGGREEGTLAGRRSLGPGWVRVWVVGLPRRVRCPLSGRLGLEVGVSSHVAPICCGLASSLRLLPNWLFTMSTGTLFSPMLMNLYLRLLDYVFLWYSWLKWRGPS